LFVQENQETDYTRIKDLAKYPELVWLNRYWLVPPTVLALATYFIGGTSALLIGFFLSTVLLWHGTFTINSLSHMLGNQRYESNDDSRNNWFLAILTMGEGWHNNHHYYQRSVRQGFHWWQIDMTYYVLRALAAVGIVWDLHVPSQKVIDGERVSVSRPKLNAPVVTVPALSGPTLADAE
jgi:stearoyl-CoA desaturase (delta-9 desaturase)